MKYQVREQSQGGETFHGDDATMTLLNCCQISCLMSPHSAYDGYSSYSQRKNEQQKKIEKERKGQSGVRTRASWLIMLIIKIQEYEYALSPLGDTAVVLASKRNRKLQHEKTSVPSISSQNPFA